MKVERYDVAVVGAGILGVATAFELRRRHPGLRMVVLERETRPAVHQSGHNSGVIHSGVYYRPGSAKARLCVLGRRLLLEHLEERGIRFELCGKLIVALTPAELGSLGELRARAEANGVEGGAVLLDAAAMREIEPHAAGLGALHVPGAGITDFAEVTARLATEVERSGVVLRFEEPVVGIEERGGTVRLRTRTGWIEAERAVACAGLRSDQLARLGGAPAAPRIVPFRGDYYVLHPERRSLVRGLIYPVPDPRFPFLGIHLTRRIDGSVWLGPNAVLAFAREGYRRRDVDLRELSGTLGYSGFRLLARRYWRTGLAEMIRDVSRSAFLRALRPYVPELRGEDLLPGPSGVRAQAVGPGGELIDDFAFDAIGRLLNVRNAPSPAATSSLAIARALSDRLEHTA